MKCFPIHGNLIAVLSALVFITLLGFPTLAAPPSSPTAAEPPAVAETQTQEKGKASELNKIDAAGNRVGDKIEQLGQSASKRMGNWINSKVVLDISWLKLIFSMLLVFVLVTAERTIRWVIQRRHYL